MTAIGRGLPAQHAGLDTVDSAHYVGADEQACPQDTGACQQGNGNRHDQALLAGTCMVPRVGAA